MTTFPTHLAAEQRKHADQPPGSRRERASQVAVLLSAFSRPCFGDMDLFDELAEAITAAPITPKGLLQLSNILRSLHVVVSERGNDEGGRPAAADQPPSRPSWRETDAGPGPSDPADLSGDAIRRHVLGTIERETGARPVQIGRRQSYRSSRSGSTAHVRTSKRHRRGPDEVSYWFGLNSDEWNEGDVFVLGCAGDAIIVVPVVDWLPYRSLMPPTEDGLREQPTIWRTSSGAYELRVGGEHVDCSPWLDNFESL